MQAKLGSAFRRGKSMSIRIMWAAFVVVVSAAATPAVALSKAGVATFHIGSAGFEMPLPAGYCLPAGHSADVAQVIAAGDKENVTDLSLFSCSGDPFANYILIKTPIPALMADVTREQALAGIGKVFDTNEFQQLLSSGELNGRAAKELGSAIGREIDLSGELKPLGKDATCGYLGGIMQVKMETTAARVSLGACLSVVGRRFMAVYVYGPDKGTAGVAAELAEARRLMETIRPTAD
jgi:hypothetical protein